MKKTTPKTCDWCGTKLKDGRCPRGSMCDPEKRNHDEQMKRIEKKEPGFAAALTEARRPKPEPRKKREE